MALEQPKKPVGGAYGYFLAEKRPEFTKACAGQKAPAISTVAGAAWKKLSEAQKAPYQKLYEAAKQKYEKDIAAFLENGGEKSKGMRAMRSEKRKAKEAKKGKNDPNKPKRPAGGAFGCFLNANRPAFIKECGGAITGASKLASAKWKVLPAAERSLFEKEYEAKKTAYEEAMKTYVPPAGADEKGPNKPKRPAGGAYGCFMNANRPAFMKECGGSIAGAAKLASAKWKVLPDAERSVFEKEFQAKKDAYEEAMKPYVPPSAPEGEEDEEEDAASPPKKARVTEMDAASPPKQARVTKKDNMDAASPPKKARVTKKALLGA